MIPEVHLSVRIAFLQILAIIGGVFTTRAAFVACGYPDANYDWIGPALFVRNYGFFLLVLPFTWTTATIYLETYGTGRWSKRWTLASGLLLLLAIVLLLFWTTFNPRHFYAQPLQQM